MNDHISVEFSTGLSVTGKFHCAPFSNMTFERPRRFWYPDTQVDPTTGLVVSSPATGTSALLDKWTVAKPDIASSVSATLSAPSHIQPGGALTYSVLLENNSQYSLNGTQVRLILPSKVIFAGTTGDTTTVQGNVVVVTIGRMAAGAEQTVSVDTTVSSEGHGNHGNRSVPLFAEVSSSSALPLFTNGVVTTIGH